MDNTSEELKEKLLIVEDENAKNEENNDNEIDDFEDNQERRDRLFKKVLSQLKLNTIDDLEQKLSVKYDSINSHLRQLLENIIQYYKLNNILELEHFLDSEKEDSKSSISVSKNSKTNESIDDEYFATYNWDQRFQADKIHAETLMMLVILENEMFIKDKLDINELDQILVEAFTLENNKPSIQRLDMNQLQFMMTSILKKKINPQETENRLTVMMNRIKKKENNINLREKIEKRMKKKFIITNPVLKAPEYPNHELNTIKYKKIMKIEMNLMEKNIFQEHELIIHSIAVSPNGKYLVSASEDTKIKVWDFQKWKEIYVLSGNSCSIHCVTISPDGVFIVSGSSRRIITVWNLYEGKEVFSLEEPDDLASWHTRIYPTSIIVTPDGKFIISGWSNGSVKLWNFDKDSISKTFTDMHTESITQLIITPDCRYLISGSYDKTIKIWDIEERKAIKTLTGHYLAVNSVAISMNGKLFASGSKDQQLIIWKLKSLTKWFSIKFLHPITSVAFNPNGKYIAVGIQCNTVKLINTQNWKLEFDWTNRTQYQQTVSSITFSPDGCTFVFGLYDTLRKFNVNVRVENELHIHENEIWSLCISPDGKFIISGSDDKTVNVWNVKENKEEFKFIDKDHKITAVAISQNGVLMASGSKGGVVNIFNLENGTKQSSFSIDHWGHILSLAISLNGKYVICGSDDQGRKDAITGEYKKPYELLVIWNEKKQLKSSVNVGPHDVKAIAISPNARFIFLGIGKIIEVWNRKETKKVFILTENSASVSSIIITLDGKYILSGLSNCSIKVWNFQEEREEFTLIEEGSNQEEDNFYHRIAMPISLTADGKFVASKLKNGSIRIWNFFERREEFTIDTDLNSIASFAISSDGSFLVTGSKDGVLKIIDLKEKSKEVNMKKRTSPDIKNCILYTQDYKFLISRINEKNIRIWNIPENKEECILLGHTSKIILLLISRNGKYLMSKSLDQIIKIWDIKSKKEKILYNNSLDLLDIISISTNKYYPRSIQGYITEDSKFILTSNTTFIETISLDFVNKSANIYPFDTRNFLQNTKTSVNQTVGQFLYTLAHFNAFTGDKKKLSELVNDPSFVLRTDLFGKSPFYYAIIKQQQGCVDILIKAIASSEKSNIFQQSIFALRNDFILLIKNSSKNLHLLTEELIISSSHVFAKMNGIKFPVLQQGISISSNLMDFKQNNSQQIPVVLQSSRIPILGSFGSIYNTKLLKAIANCKNYRVIKSPIIIFYIEIQWKLLIKYMILFAIILSINIILLLLLIGLNNFSWYFVIPFYIANLLLATWETIQLLTQRKAYFNDYWNYLDILRFFGTMSWITFELFDIKSLYFRWIIAVLNLLRGITGFRLFNGTRFYIDLILRSLNDIFYFFVMFAYSTFSFGFLFMISRQENLSFQSIWAENYDLNFGNYHNEMKNGSEILNYIVYFGATIVNVVLMLNLLISILGDSYDKFQLEQNIVDIKEKAKNCLEIQYMLFWKSRFSELNYIKVCNVAFKNEEDDDWQGRLKYIDNKLDRIQKEITKNQVNARVKEDAEFEANESLGKGLSKMCEIMVSNSKLLQEIKKGQQSLEDRISSIEENVHILNVKFDSTDSIPSER